MINSYVAARYPRSYQPSHWRESSRRGTTGALPGKVRDAGNFVPRTPGPLSTRAPT